MKPFRSGAAALVGLALAAGGAEAASVTLQNATATYSQTAAVGGYGDWSVGRAIDGLTYAGGTLEMDSGWAIGRGFSSTETRAETAAFETAGGVNAAGVPTLLTFRLYQSFQNFNVHTLGRFRLSVTTADRGLFADGLANGGDVGADGIWTVLTPATATAAAGATLSILGDGSILASGTLAAPELYTITASTSLAGITGIRLEVLADPSLPGNGPGRAPYNGNFVLSELTLDAASQAAVFATVPEPSTFALALLGLGGGLVALRRRGSIA